MPEPPKPANEAQRLETLRALRILDTDPEESFDRLTRLAASIFDAPIAQLSLVDEHREWFKAKCGVDFREDERRSAFCAHTILSDEVLVIEDTLRDERVLDNPKVAGAPGIRFYAGAPLVTESGVVLGALCVKDFRPRKPGPAGTRILAELAAIAVEEMEHRLALTELRKWQRVFERAEWGIAMADDDRQTLDVVNRTYAEMHGFSVEELQGRPIAEIFAPEERPHVHEHLRTIVERGHHVFESRHVRRDGSVFPVQVDAVAVRDRRGNLLYRAAHVQDITERKRFENELTFTNTILSTQQEASLDGILVVDREGRFVSFNRRFVTMWGLPDEILATKRDDLALDYVTKLLEDPRSFLARVKHLYERPDERSFDEIRLKDGRVFDRYSAPLIGPGGENHGRVWYFRDVTERERAARSLRESQERLSRIVESAMDAIVTLDEDGNIAVFNAAAEDAFRCSSSEVMGQPFDRFASTELRDLVESCRKAFRRKGSRKRYLWAPDGVSAIRSTGERFPIEATVSGTDVAGGQMLTIILRDVNERTESERRLRDLQMQNVYLQEEFKTELGFEEIIGRSAAMQEALQAAQQVAGTDSTVLLTGETGTGKELLARAIHRLSERSGRVLVKTNCAALPGGLIESELFGHEKGAFTGAVNRKTGRFELAHQGTIFLDEIGDLPPELQAKLLRVLQEGEFERVGGTQTLRVDVRAIAATNRDLAQAVEQGRFRSDLFYRLNVFPIRMPPLRERRDDIPLLAQHFVLKYASTLGKRIDSVGRRTMAALQAYDWPGNVRELQNVVERAVILTRGSTLDIGRALPDTGVGPSGGRATTLLAEVERSHILAVLEQTGWRVSGRGGAAELLGLKRTTLEARMKRLGIRRHK